MTRHVQVIGLAPAMRQRYIQLHENVWPEIEATIRACGIRDYSIHLHGTILIGVFDYIGDDFAADMRRMAEDPRTQEWWQLTSPCQVPLADSSPESPWLELPPLWRLS